MTTPAVALDALDWATLVTRVNDQQSLQFVQRLVQFQHHWLNTQITQLEEVQRALQEHQTRLGEQQAGQ